MAQDTGFHIEEKGKGLDGDFIIPIGKKKIKVNKKVALIAIAAILGLIVFFFLPKPKGGEEKKEEEEKESSGGIPGLPDTTSSTSTTSETVPDGVNQDMNQPQVLNPPVFGDFPSVSGGGGSGGGGISGGIGGGGRGFSNPPPQVPIRTVFEDKPASRIAVTPPSEQMRVTRTRKNVGKPEKPEIKSPLTPSSRTYRDLYRTDISRNSTAMSAEERVRQAPKSESGIPIGTSRTPRRTRETQNDRVRRAARSESGIPIGTSRTPRRQTPIAPRSGLPERPKVSGGTALERTGVTQDRRVTQAPRTSSGVPIGTSRTPQRIAPSGGDSTPTRTHRRQDRNIPRAR